MGTLALVVQYQAGDPEWVQTFTDEREINVLESALTQRKKNPIETVIQFREQQAQEDEDFGNYIEDLLSQPFVRPEIQTHGIQWLKSKMRIENHKRTEANAARVIAEFAYKMFQQDSNKTDFLLAGPIAQVRIRVFVIDPEQAQAA